MTVNNTPVQTSAENAAEQRFSPKSCRKQAAVLLRNGGRRLTLIWICLGTLALLVSGMLALIYTENAVIDLLYCLEADELWIGLFSWLADGIVLAVMAFLLLPLLTGVIPFAVTVTDGRPDASLLFGAFGNAGAYGHALLLLLSFLWRIAAVAAVIFAVDGGLTLLFPAQEALPGSAIFFMLVIGVVVLLLGIMLCGGNFLTPYLAAVQPEKTFAEYKRASRAATSGRYFEIFLFRLFFIMTSLLSLLTVGIALVACVLPLWLTAYVLAARDLLARSAE